MMTQDPTTPAHGSSIFDDLDTFETERVIPNRELVAAKPLAQAEAYDAATGALFVEVCGKCRGSGIYYGRSSRGHQCFPCKGAGKFTFRTSPEQRAKAKAASAARKARVAAAGLEAFTAANPEDGAWIVARAGSFDFATAMKSALERFGHLTEKQHATVTRLRLADADRDARRAAEREQRDAAAPALDIAKIEEAFQSARDKAAAKGVMAPKLLLRLAGFKFSPAPATGSNAGALYVKSKGGEYLGKVQGGKFKRAFACDEVTEAEVVRVASDPKEAAIAYGRETGSCACCGRELSDPASVALGIGPICAGKFGW